MCLAIPGKVLQIENEDGLKMGKVDFSGSISKACLEYIENVNVDDYVIVHAGFAISKLDKEAAEESIKLHKQMAEEAAKAGRDIYDNPLEESSSDK